MGHFRTTLPSHGLVDSTEERRQQNPIQLQECSRVCIAQNPYQTLIKLAPCHITAAATACAQPMGGQVSKHHALSLTLPAAEQHATKHQTAVAAVNKETPPIGRCSV